MSRTGREGRWHRNFARSAATPRRPKAACASRVHGNCLGLRSSPVPAGGAIVGSTAFAQRTFGWSLEPRLASLVNWPDVGRAAQPAVMAAIDVEDVRLESTHQACLSESRGARIDSCFGSGNGITATRGEASQLVSAAYFDCLMSTHPHAFCAASQQNMSRMTGRIVKGPPD